MFSVRNTETQTNILASYLPNGKTFVSKNIKEKNLRKLLKGFSGTGQEVDQIVKDIIDKYNLKETTDETFLSLWEKAVGIPDECIEVEDDVEQRRLNIIFKLLAKNVQTDTDFVNLLETIGFEIDITSPLAAINPGLGSFPLQFPINFFQDAKQARFTIIVRINNVSAPVSFPLQFPIQFSLTTNEVECLINKLKPANVEVRFNYTEE